MKSLTFKFSAYLLALLVAGVAAGCDGDEDAEASSGKPGGGFQVNSAVLVETAEAESGPFSVRGDYAGEVVAQRTAEVAFEVQGRIVMLDYDIGERVEEGQTLARIEQTTYRQRVREARAAVEMGQASLGETEVAVENLEADLRRKRPLLDKQLIAEREFEDLEAQLRQARQKVAVAKATLDQNRARLQTARENLRNTEIRAPFDARIAARHVDLGTHVGPSQPVFRLVSDANVYLRINVPEQDSPNVAVDEKVRVRMGSLGGAELTGRVARVAPSIDPKTRMLRVDVILDAEEAEADDEVDDETDEVAAPDELSRRIRPGMYAQVQIDLGHRDQAVTVPKQALLEERGGAPFVWVADDGEARKQTLLVGLRGRDRVEVVEGLEGGEDIVLRGFEKLEPGKEVQSLSEPKDTPDTPQDSAGNAETEGEDQ